jgi:hypothetical protein
MLHKMKPKKPESEDDMLMEALAEVAGEVDERERRRKRRYKHLLPAWVDRRLLFLLLIILGVLVADGVRRENQEFETILTQMQGSVMVGASESLPCSPAVPNQKLTDGCVIKTGVNSWAALEFPDGSATTIDQGSVFVVRTLEYNRSGRWRSRAFLLRAGRVWSKVGDQFGKDSQMKVYTPSAVAAVRGTQYAVSYDPTRRRTVVQCNEGYVTSEGFRGTPAWVGQGGQTSVDYGAPPTPAAWMSPADKQTFSQGLLNKPIPPELWLKTFELTVTQVLDAPLSILGIGKSSWARGAADIARRAACMEQLRRLQQLLEDVRYPDFVNPATLEELTILSALEARRILTAFQGDALVRYESTNSGQSYRILARARDKKQTLFELTPTGIVAVKETAAAK